MKFLTNLYDPRLPDAKYEMTLPFDQTAEQAWEYQKEWLSGKVIGEPRAIDLYTVEQLKAAHFVGIYSDSD